MRLVRFEDESGVFHVDFHPRMTVISGLPAHIRERLADAVAAIPRGGEPRGRGIVEVHGVHLDLDRDTFELLELDEDIDPIVRSSDLPGHRPQAPRAAASIPNRTEPAGATDPSPELEELNATLAALRDEIAETEQSIASWRSKLDAADAERDRLERERADAAGCLDPAARGELEAARAALGELEAAEGRATVDDAEPDGPGSVGAGATTDPAAEIADLEERLSAAIERSNELKRRLRTLESIDPEPVRVAHDVLVTLVDSAGGRRRSEPVAERLAKIDALLEDWRRHLDAGPADVPRPPFTEAEIEALRHDRDAVLERVESIRAELDRPEPDPTLTAELEQVHNEIFELDGHEPRFRAARHRQRLEELRARERKLLEQLGFETWSAYVMRWSDNPTYTEADYDAAYREFTAVDRQLSEALAALDRHRAAVEVAEAHAAESERLVGESVRVLERPELSRSGPGAIIDALLAKRAALVPGRSAEAPRDPEALELAVSNLRWALEHVGVDLPERALAPAELCSLAGGWLDAMSELPDRIEQVKGERAELEASIEEMGARYEARLADDGASDPNGSTPDEPAPSAPDAAAVAAARSRVEAAEARLDAHRRTEDVVASIDERLERLNVRRDDLEYSIREREARLDAVRRRLAEVEVRVERLIAESQSPAPAMPVTPSIPLPEPGPEPSLASALDGSLEEETSEGAESIEWYVLARLAQQRSVSFVGSVPVLFDDAFAEWSFDELRSVYERLERMGEVIQIILLTDDPDVVEWARDGGVSRARVIDSLAVAS